MLSSEREELTPEEIQQGWKDARVRPLWEIPQAHAADPAENAPVVWTWRTLEPLIARAIGLTSPAVAERRVLSLIDPAGRPGDFQSITNLNAALQILLPGEVARPHRHAMDALRFVMEGGGAVTRVDGKLAPMETGDLVITPGGSWHEHWHEGAGPMVWLDVLNVHMHLHLGTFWFEPGPVHDVPEIPADAAFATANVVPDMPRSAVSPVFRYPLADAKRALDAAPPGKDGARRVRYVNPLTGGPVMPLLDCYLMRLDAGQSTRPFRTSAHAVCTVVEGRGTTSTGGGTIAWEQRDVFTLPSAASIVHTAHEPSYVFIATDREILNRLDLLREAVGET
jgi:gentisate 1,2-dioxygenase